MFYRIAGMLALAAIMLWANAKEWKASPVRDRVVYAALLAPALYLGFIYATHLHWPNLNDLVDAVFAGPAKRIIASVKLPS